MPPQVTILPDQAARLMVETAKTGSAIGVTQFGSSLLLDTGQDKFVINAGGNDILPATQETSPLAE